MYRLTERFSNGQAASYWCGSNCKYDHKYCCENLENCPAMEDILEKLAHYEDLEEAGMAIEALKEPERKKGHWKDFDCGNSYECTACGQIWTLNDGTPVENNMNYCPKCGADMKGEQK